ncbi:uncharacterized protein LOC105795873 [Gossypium raimondii]|uniref:uncharacterized protein LOC105795873 n=1 Tax=Gossypium raimondii TaxID=29730 RepID=UPI00063A9079|nr:uncharacterized protein LOC105795873 [Gossypium raimondii]
MGIANNIQNSIRDITLSIGFWESMSLASRLEHKAMWAIKQVNMDYGAGGKKRLLDITKLEEIRRNAYENATIYKEKTKRWHDKIILQRQLFVDQQVLLNSQLKLHPGTLRLRWCGPFKVVVVFSHGVVIIRGLHDKHQFKVNGQRLKHYFGNNNQK